MKMTTAGLPKSESDPTSSPETVSGRLKAGIGVPSSRMLEGVRDMRRAVPRLPGAGKLGAAAEPAAATCCRRGLAADGLRQREGGSSSAFVVHDGVDRGAT